MEDTLKMVLIIVLLVFVREAGAQTFTLANTCGSCHVAIHAGWKGSMHANAVRDPVFYPIFLEASRETKGKSDRLCLSCHAPLGLAAGKTDINDPLVQEGVSCDFCHRVKEVNLMAKSPFVLEKTGKKWGPLKEVSSSFHATGYAPHFEKSVFCAGCHEYKNPVGVPILETFSEWQESSLAREGKECQSCHMPTIAGLTVPPRVKPVKDVYINSHEAMGGHSVEQVKKAVTVKMGEMRRAGDKVHVAVRLENVGSGHRVPTGLPTRKLVLRFQATSGGVPVYSEERIFQKVLLNEKGEIISKDSDVFLHASSIKGDNRLEPRKPRDEHFTFLAPEGRPIEVEALVYYLYQPRLIQETEMKVELGKEQGVIR